MFWQLVASIIGVFAIAGLVWYLGLGQVKLTSEAQVKRLAEDMVSGFNCAEIVMSENRDAALALGDDRSFVLLKRHGAKFAARRLPAPIKFTQVEDYIEIDSGEMAYGKVSLKLPAQKAERLADRLLTGM